MHLTSPPASQPGSEWRTSTFPCGSQANGEWHLPSLPSTANCLPGKRSRLKGGFLLKAYGFHTTEKAKNLKSNHPETQLSAGAYSPKDQVLQGTKQITFSKENPILSTFKSFKVTLFCNFGRTANCAGL